MYAFVYGTKQDYVIPNRLLFIQWNILQFATSFTKDI